MHKGAYPPLILVAYKVCQLNRMIESVLALVIEVSNSSQGNDNYSNYQENDDH